MDEQKENVTPEGQDTGSDAEEKKEEGQEGGDNA